MRRTTLITVLGTLGLLAGLIIAPAGAVRASTFTVAPPTLVPDHPFATCTIGGPGTNYVNAEVEPRVAVNPTTVGTSNVNMIGVFQQDRWNNGGAHGLVAGVTHDGGVTWSTSWAHFSQCSGGTAANGGNYERASDPWVTFAPNGDAYQISISFNQSNPVSSVLVSKSTNGGDTWSNPTTLIRDDSVFNFNDKESITADPTSASRVYAVWDRSRFPSDNANFEALHSFAFRGDPMFSRTTDGGATWSTARDIAPLNQNIFTIGNQIVVLPNGTLVDVFSLSRGSGRQPSVNQSLEAVMRSTDHGLTWSRPITISTDQAVAVVDPNTGQEVRTGAGLPDAAVDPTTGAIYVVWADGRFSGGAHDDIALSKSTDGGLTWSTPMKVNQTPNGAPAFTPSVRVSDNGTVAVNYYDFRNLPANDTTTLPTDYWIVHSHDGGAAWSESHVAGSFDMMTAPRAPGFFVGDYEGLTNVGNTFVPFFIQTNSGNTTNRTDPFETTAG